MNQNAATTAETCIFCAIASRQAVASVAYEDKTVVAFMDRYPVTPGHLLVVPRQHVAGLEDVDEASGGHVWSAAHRLARALGRSRIPCDGINVLLCDGEVAFQTIASADLPAVTAARPVPVGGRARPGGRWQPAGGAGHAVGLVGMDRRHRADGVGKGNDGS